MQLLIVGSLGGHLTSASQIAMKRGAKVTSVHNGEEALQAIRSGFGADLHSCRRQTRYRTVLWPVWNRNGSPFPSSPAVSKARSTETAVAAIKAGAKEYLPLPPDPDLIAAVLEAVVEESHAIIHPDPAMKQVLKLADQIAPSPAPVLITGESGTGKEVMARYIHAKSRRSSNPFIALNCAAIPENLLESELVRARKGRLFRRCEPAASASSNRPMAAPCCSTKSAKWTPVCRPNCCAPFRNAKSTGSADRRR